MLESFGNIWDNVDNYDVVVITTNGFVKSNGEAVMGRGIALEAKERFPWLPKALGDWLLRTGNVPGVFGADFDPDTGHSLHILTMPVKPMCGPNGEPGWRVKASLNLILYSTIGMVELLDTSFFTDFRKAHDLEPYKVIMPRPGCGNGGLKWEDVKPVIEPYLDDRFTVMERA